MARRCWTLNREEKLVFFKKSAMWYLSTKCEVRALTKADSLVNSDCDLTCGVANWQPNALIPKGRIYEKLQTVPG